MQPRRYLRIVRAVALAGCCGVVRSPAAAQSAPQSAAQVSVATGTATDQRGVRSNAVTVAPSVTLQPNAHVSFSLGGSATGFQTSAWAVGGSATVAARSNELSGTALTLNAGGGVSRSSFGATFTVADATPAVEWTAGHVTLFGGGRVASGITSVRTAATSSLAPVPVPGQTTLVSVNRTSVGSVYGAQWRVLGENAAWPVTVSYREERNVVSGVTAIDRTAGVAFEVGQFGFSGAGGERALSADRSRFASGSASFALAPSVSLVVSGGSYPGDRLTGAAGGRFFSAGISLSFASGGPHLPAPRGVGRPAAGFTRLSIRAAKARTVEIYGDWNDWTPVAATRAANGVWYVDVPLSPGEYRYAFRVNEVEWRVPDGADTAKDGFGGKSAYVIVSRDSAEIGTRSREDR